MIDEQDAVSRGVVRVEMDKSGLAYVRFRVRDLADGMYPLARKLVKKAGYAYDGVNAHTGPGWKLAGLVKTLRDEGFEPSMGTSVAYEMGRLASAHDYDSAAERADARMDAIEAASGKRYRAYQRDDVRWMEASGSCILANEMRTGKTPTCLAMVPPQGAVIVGPVGVKTVWERHVREWLPWMTPKVNGDPSAMSPGDVVIINYERVDGHVVLPPGILLVADEAQALKNTNARRTKAFAALAGSVIASGGRVVLTTGTPAQNGRWQEFWSLLEILQRGESMFGSKRKFAAEWKDSYSLDKPITGPLSLVMSRRTYAEVVDYLPPFEWSRQDVYWEDVEESGWGMADTAQETRSSLDRLWETHQRSEDVLAAMHQSPTCIGDYSRLRAQMAALKAVAVASWAYEMVQAGVPCVVTSNYRDAVLLVSAALNETGEVRSDHLVGGMSESERTEVVRRFQAGELDVLCFTQGTGGVGLDLSRADAVGAVDLSFVPGQNDQAFARVMSVSDPRPKTGVRFVLDHPLEEAVDRILSFKTKSIADTVGRVSSGARTYGQALFGDLKAGVATNGVPPEVDLDELGDMLKGLA